jgi:hypothetical protein
MVPRPEVTAPRRRRSRLIRKRRQNFLRLSGAALFTLIVGLIPGVHWLLIVNLGVDIALGLYISQLRKWKREEADFVPAEQAVAHAEPPLPPAAERIDERQPVARAAGD